MKVKDIYYVDNNTLFNIPPTPERRRIVVPLLLAETRPMQAGTTAIQTLKFNGGVVAQADGSNNRITISSWSGYIEANQNASIQSLSETHKNDSGTLNGITVMIGDA